MHFRFSPRRPHCFCALLSIMMIAYISFLNQYKLNSHVAHHAIRFVYVYMHPKAFTYSMGQGFNIQRSDAARQMAWYKILNARHHFLRFEAPTFSPSMRQTDGTIPFTHLFNLSKFHYLFEEWPETCVWFQLSEVVKPGFVFGDARACVNTTLQQADQMAKAIVSLPEERRVEAGVLRDLIAHPAETVTNQSYVIVHAILGSVTRFACLHLRVEPDFAQAFVRPPAFYNTNDIAAKLGTAAAESNAIRATRELLFVAGNISPEELKPLQNLGVWERVVTKAHYLNYTRTSVPMTDMAAIDFEVCKHANVFIGNNHSSWSELMADYMMWVRQLNRETSVLQINPDKSIDHGDGGLFPFCGKNHEARHPNLNCTFIF
ncbi:MAG: hypothetical protein J3K34DRAFT_446264 [Monoraphidium minutum]|nr:MAG: hypothetical protein J3K34DRAFT_446264 [Monoraphidium minutum]